MKLAKEPKEIDFVIKSEPWTEKDLADFRVLIKEIKTRNNRRKVKVRTYSKVKNDAQK